MAECRVSKPDYPESQANGMFLPYTLNYRFCVAKTGAASAPPRHNHVAHLPPYAKGEKSGLPNWIRRLESWSSGLAPPRGWPVVLGRLPQSPAQYY